LAAFPWPPVLFFARKNKAGAPRFRPPTSLPKNQNGKTGGDPRAGPTNYRTKQKAVPRYPCRVSKTPNRNAVGVVLVPTRVKTLERPSPPSAGTCKARVNKRPFRQEKNSLFGTPREPPESQSPTLRLPRRRKHRGGRPVPAPPQPPYCHGSPPLPPTRPCCPVSPLPVSFSFPRNYGWGWHRIYTGSGLGGLNVRTYQRFIPAPPRRKTFPGLGWGYGPSLFLISYGKRTPQILAVKEER